MKAQAHWQTDILASWAPGADRVAPVKSGTPGSMKTCLRTRLAGGTPHQDQEKSTHPPGFRMTFVQP